MILIACVDNHMGMFFNRRRQSQDRVLRQRILDRTADSRLWMDTYSAKQFADAAAPQIQVAEDFLQKALPGEFCFVEDQAVRPFERQIEKIILYKWNRTYPADQYFDVPLANWKLKNATDFQGSSHDAITEEVYCR